MAPQLLTYVVALSQFDALVFGSVSFLYYTLQSATRTRQYGRHTQTNSPAK